MRAVYAELGPLVEETFAFWRELGFRCSEYISTDDDDERLTGAWLLRKPTVHDVALTVGRGSRLHHVGLYVAEPTGVLNACDQLAAAGSAGAIERGPGRHGVSNAFFVVGRRKEPPHGGHGLIPCGMWGDKEVKERRYAGGETIAGRPDHHKEHAA